MKSERRISREYEGPEVLAELLKSSSCELTVEDAYAGALALGCVIRGETYHFEIVAGESSRALMDLTVREMLPVGNGILTVENEEQAIVRADPAQGDKGGDAARAALTLHLLRKQAGLV